MGNQEDISALNAAIADDVATNWHPVGCDTVRSIVDHEIGHQLDDLLSLHADPEVLALFANELSVESLSRYALVNIKEFVAEAWAEYRNNPNPRPLAQRVGEIIMDRYRSSHGR